MDYCFETPNVECKDTIIFPPSYFASPFHNKEWYYNKYMKPKINKKAIELAKALGIPIEEGYRYDDVT